MIHTVDLKFEFPNSNIFNCVFQRLKEFSNAHGFNVYPAKTNDMKSSYWKTHVLKYYGITITLAIHIGRISGRFIELTVNCPALIYNDERKETELSRYPDFNVLSDKFTMVVNYINDNIFIHEVFLPNDINAWKVKRIDYAKDIIVNDPDIYIRLFYKGGIPKGFKMERRDKESYHIKSDKYTLNFYNKTLELKEMHGIELPYNKLRFEVQCFSKKLNIISEKYNLSSKRLIDFWDENISCDIVTESIAKIIGPYDFYRYSKVRSYLISMKGNHNKVQCLKLIDLLNGSSFTLMELYMLLPQNKLSTEEIEAMVNNIYNTKNERLSKNRKEFHRKVLPSIILRTGRYYMKKFKLSVLTLPDNYKETYLKNPIKIINESRVQY